jgi:transposase
MTQIVLDLPGFVVLAAGEYGGELELLVETTTTGVHCH